MRTRPFLFAITVIGALLYVQFGEKVALGDIREIFQSREAQKAAERAAFYQTKAAEWAAFCKVYDCDDIPLGYVFKSAGDNRYLFRHRSAPNPEARCLLLSDSRDETEYSDGKSLRGASLNRNGFRYSVDCDEDYYKGRIWEDSFFRSGGFFWLFEPSINRSVNDILGTGGRSSREPKKSYLSLMATARPATGDFVDVTPHNWGTRVYVSTRPLFQGRYIGLFCHTECELTSVVFAEDRPLKTLHVEDTLQILRHEYDCRFYELLTECGPPMREHLERIARYVRFLDKALHNARHPPLRRLDSAVNEFSPGSSIR